MMFAVTRIPSSLIEDRLDARYNAPLAVETRKKILTSGIQTGTVGSLYNLVCGPFGSTLTSDEHNANGEVLLIQPTNISGDSFSDTSSWRITKKALIEKDLKTYPQGTLLFARVGIYPHVGIIPKGIGLCTISSSMIAGLPKRHLDAHYFVAFFKCSLGNILLNAAQKVTAQPTIGTTEIANTLVPIPSGYTQKYIGDKVRQAEQLRAWAKRLERSLDVFIAHFQPEKKEYKKLCSRVPNNLLTNMLTATTYKERYISNQKNLKVTSCTQPISYFLASVTNGFDERNEIENGLPYIKVADVRAGYIDLKNSPRVRLSALTDASTKQKPKKGDLLLTRKGSFGIAAVVMESASFLCSSEVFSCKPSKPEFMPILSWFLNSEAGNMQFWQFSTGTTMPGINQENLQNILIPDFSDCDIQQFNSIHKNIYEAKKNAELLTDTAKTLVEALIEGQLTEQQLIQAQQALEDGDYSLDQAIISKLSAEGYAIEGATPLFSDVDELNSLLEDAAQAEAEE